MANFALERISRLLGKEQAFAKFAEAAAAEEAGDCSYIKLYKQAFRMWDALDSVVDDDGLPVAVRREAEDANIECNISVDVRMDTEEAPRFNADSSTEWLAYLKEHGYCVLAGVSDEQSVQKAKQLLWDFLESVPGSSTRRHDPSTWDKDWLPNSGNGLLGIHGFGQSAFCWQARLLPKVRQAFEQIWTCKDVIVSFDGGNVFRPWVHKREWKTAGGWWHVDQNSFLSNQDGFSCVQGLVTFTDATPESGGLCVIPGSHKHHHDVCARSYAHMLSGHFVQVQPADPVLAHGAKLVCAKAGDLILWDSRCVHCNTPGLVESENPSCSQELLRVVAYVCMTPASWASSHTLEQRKQGFINNATTDHIPHEWHGAGDRLSWPSRNTWGNVSFVQKRLIVGASLALLDQAAESKAVCEEPTDVQVSTDEGEYGRIDSKTHEHEELNSLESLNEHLKRNSYLHGRSHATWQDFERFQMIQVADLLKLEKLPHLRRWHTHMQRLMAKWGHFDRHGNCLAA
jgi:ectoine hydroxylase-related dioxygenase (phytanoyl-CoA dioxygenase family)